MTRLVVYTSSGFSPFTPSPSWFIALLATSVMFGPIDMTYSPAADWLGNETSNCVLDPATGTTLTPMLPPGPEKLTSDASKLAGLIASLNVSRRLSMAEPTPEKLDDVTVGPAVSPALNRIARSTLSRPPVTEMP